MDKKQKAVLLVNVGTPDKPETADVRKYLSEFLNDKRIINLPWLYRKVLVNGIIVPFRAPKSAKLYQKLWTPEGSPLVLNAEKFAAGLRKKLDNSFHIYTAMRYGNPSLNKALNTIRNGNYDEVIVFPLFPQYSSSTTGTIIDYVMKTIRQWHVIPELHFVSQFYNHPGFLSAFTEQISSYHPENFDHILFSYHGLPNQHIKNVHPDISVSGCACETKIPSYGKYCYKATCYETSRLLAKKLNIEKQKYSVSFQSRFSKNWLQPFTDEKIAELARQGIEKILVVVPSFVADCLESLVEIKQEARDIFLQNGGKELILVESLNSQPLWINTAVDIVLNISN